MHLMTDANFGVVEMHPSRVAADLTDGTAAAFPNLTGGELVLLTWFMT